MLAIIVIIKIEIFCDLFKFPYVARSVVKYIIVKTCCHLLSICLLNISGLLLNYLFLFWSRLWFFLYIVINFFWRGWWLRFFWGIRFFNLRSFGFLKLENDVQKFIGVVAMASWVRQEVELGLVFLQAKLVFNQLIFFYGVEASCPQKVNYQRLSRN